MAGQFAWDIVPAEYVTPTQVAGNAVLEIVAPAAGIEEYLIEYVTSVFTADGTAATRNLYLAVRDADDNIVQKYGGANYTASGSGRVDFFPGAQNGTPTNGDQQLSIPNRLVIAAGHKLVLVVDNGVAGDTIDARAVVKHRRYDQT